MDKIKIVFVLGTLDIGGTEKQFIETVCRLNRERFDLRVLAFPCWGNLRTEIEALKIPLTCLDFSGLPGKFRSESYGQLYHLIRKMIHYFRQEKPHIVQSYLFWANIYGCLAAKLAGVPIIITGRRGIGNKHALKWYYKWLQNLSNLWATAMIANSRAVQQNCLQEEKFVTSQKIRVIYNGIDLQRYTPNQENYNRKRAFSIPENAPMIGIIANLHVCKGHRDFLQAAAIVLQTYPQTIFLIVGRDEGIRGELEVLAKELGIYDSVIFTGERDDIPEILSLLDIQVSSSLTEGLSNAILEGMAARNPIVATDVGGNSELVVHEATGLLVPPEDAPRLAEAMMRLLGDRTLQIHMGIAGQQRVAKLFRIEHTVQQMEALYQSLVSEKKCPNY